MSVAADLWAANSDLADAALAHPFVAGIADGSLPLDRFSRFIAQDSFFLDAFARAYALALAKSPDTATLLEFAGLLTGVRDELLSHRNAYADTQGVELGVVVAAPATLAYTEFVLATAATGTLGVICAAMTPCMRLYAWLGSSLATMQRADLPPLLADWITAYADPSFQSLAAQLEALLDAHLHATEVPAASTAYRRAMTLELAFFAATVHS
jgi:thiaminase/transcriptional activator TenA